VRSFQGRNQTFVADDYLVVEVAIYPPKGKDLLLFSGHFTLRVNDSKRALMPVPPSFVAASLRYPDWERRPSVVAGAGAGDASVIIGRPPATERFPGDPRPGQTRLPRPPRAPDQGPPGAVERDEPPKADEVVVETALPQGTLSSPASGFLYFPFKGKTKSIRSVKLLYHGSAGTATLKLL
jgi:hypothetical protein